MTSKQSLMSALFFIALSTTAQANWSQEIIRSGNVQFLDFSMQENTNPFAIKVEKQTTSKEGEKRVVYRSSGIGVDPIMAWAKSYGHLPTNNGFSNYYPIVIYYPVSIYYPIYYSVYTPYYFN